MPSLHLTKVAVGCATLDALYRRLGERAMGGVVEIHTRYRPKREAELDGGSLFWIVQHRLVLRQPILGFDDRPEAKGIVIRLGDPVAIRPKGLRAHQGWRYLTDEDAPVDVVSGEVSEALPPEMARELMELALI